MKHIQVILTSLLLLIFAPSQISAEETDAVNQPQFGKKTITVNSNQELTYYDMNGTEDINSSLSSNSQSLLVFKPAEAGMSIQITFEKIEVIGSSDSYPAFMNIYNGEADAANTFSYATKTSEVNSSNLNLPDGKLIEKLSGTYTNKVYYSTEASGALSVGYLYRYAEDCSGWVAKVKCIKLNNMSVTGGGSSYDKVKAEPTDNEAIALVSPYVQTEGVMNADTLTSVSFKLAKNESAVDAMALKLYEGENANFKNVAPIDATLTEDGDVYTFNLKRILTSGKNIFTIAGDIKKSAAIGAQIQAEITKITTKSCPDGIQNLTTATPVTVSVPNIVLISSESKTVEVGDSPINFYDDGGPDGKVTADFNGSITFTPTTEGKKVMIEFSKVAIFEGSLYSQYIKVYNGKAANEANLIQVVKKGTTPLIHSTSTDGALTVKFESTTSYTSDGFEAKVSQFQPQAMAVDNIAVGNASDATVCAGDTDQTALSINLKTKNTEPALKASKFAFTTNNTNTQITKATLYSTKRDSIFASTTKIGETNVTSDAFEITAASPVELNEGNNYFWLTYTISETAANDSKVDAALTSVTLSDGKHNVTNGSPDGSRTVENVIYSNEGTTVKKVNNSMLFKTRNASEYSTKYAPGTEDCITTFLPANKNRIIQLDFSKFDLYYSSSSYGTKSTLKVYSGNGTKGELLWELKNADEKTTGPGKKLRSKSTDGAITVVFNPNTSYSSYTGNGFEATASEYESKTMTVDSIIALQTTKDIAAVGSKNASVITVDITTSGDTGNRKFNGINIDMKGSQNDVDKVYVFNAGQNNSAPTADSTAMATITPNKTKSEQTIAFEKPFTLNEGHNYFRIIYDISTDAKAEDIIDASVTGVKIDDKDVITTKGDPDGSRTLKNIYILKSGENGEIKIANGAKLMFYDDGGAEGNVSKSFNGTVTFAPKAENATIKIKFKEWNVVYGDYMHVYNGGEKKTTEDAKYGKYDKPDSLVSKSADGKITINFTTGKSSTAEGFEIEVSAYEKKALEINSIAITDIAPVQIMKGQTDVPMLKIDVNVTGDYGTTLDLSKFKLEPITNTTIASAKMFYTDTLSNYAPTNLYGTCTNGQSEITGSYIIKEAGSYKFWMTYDISTTANEHDKVSAKLRSVSVGRDEINITEPVTASTVVNKGKSGIFTIGTGGNYATIQAAINDITTGIDGKVILNIKKGIYNEIVNVPDIPGSSSNNTVTLQSESGNYNDVKIYSDSYSDPGYSEDKMAHEYGVLTVNGADYFTLKGVEITTKDMSFPSVIHINNQSRHVTVDSCYIHTDMSTSYTQDVNLIGHYATSTANANNDYLTIENNLLEGGYIGINMGGTGYVALPKEKGGQILNNKLFNQGSKAIYVMDETNAKIIGNKIENTRTGKTDFNGIDMQVRETSTESIMVERNIIDLATKNYATAMNIRNIVSTTEHPAYIINNVINVNGSVATTSGIRLNSPSTNLFIANNTIRVKGTATSAVLYINDNMENVNVLNNILQNESGNCVYKFYKTENVKTVKYSNNAVFTNGNVFANDKTDIATFDEWKNASNETNSYNERVAFLSDEILEPAVKGDLLDALPLSYVKTDINGTLRNKEKPTIGAFEYSDDNTAPVMDAGYPMAKEITDSTASIRVKADKNSKVFFSIKKANETAPVLSDILASTDSVMAYKDTETAFLANGLVKNEVYIAYSVAENLRGTAGMICHSEKFLASGEKRYETPNASITVEGDTVNEGENAQLKAYVTSGTAPFTIVWFNGKHKQIATATLDNLDDVTSEFRPTECDDYYAVVTDAKEKQASDTCRVIVRGQAKTATLENLYLNSESFWSGPDSKGTDTTGLWGDKQKVGSFVSGSYSFSNDYSLNYKSWSGFAYANCTSTSFKTLADQYNSCVGTGYNGSDNYAVAYNNGNIEILNSEEGDTIRGFYITNDAYTLNSITNGDSFAKKFEQGSYLKAIFTAKKADGTTSSVEYYLADYRSEKEVDHYYLNTWQWVDLRCLGKVKSISFMMDGSDKSNGYLNTPAYFCLDNFNGKRVIQNVAPQTVKESLKLSDFFTFDDTNASVVYAFADSLSKDIVGKAKIEGDYLKLTGENMQFSPIISATQKGKIQFVRIPIDFVTNINNFSADKNNITGYYTLDGKRLDAPQKGVNIIRMSDGTTRKVIVR